MKPIQKMNRRPRVLPAILSALIASPPIGAAELDQLKLQIEALEQQLKALKSQVDSQTPAVTRQDLEAVKQEVANAA